MRWNRIHAIAFVLALPLSGQVEVYPRDAHVNLYFPQLADGGNATQRWQTSFVFVNSSSQTVNVLLYLYANDGSPLPLDLGEGPASRVTLSIQPLGRATLRSRMATSSIVTGWAVANATLPVQGTVFFRQFIGDQPGVELSASATLPSPAYQSPANRNLGIALANVYSVPISVSVRAYDQGGAAVGSALLPLSPREHRSFNLWEVLPALPSKFIGSVQMWPDVPSYVFLAWTLNEDGGLLSTLPSGRIEWPIAHWDRIWLVFQKALEAAKLRYPAANWDTPPVTLKIDPRLYGRDGRDVINAFSSTDGSVRIPYSISELISDSQSELGWIVAHEVGHQVQFRNGKLQYDPSNVETDADIIGLQLCLDAGFDPYAAAGALAKMAMVSGTSGLTAQTATDHNVTIGLDQHLSLERASIAFGTSSFRSAKSPATGQRAHATRRYPIRTFPAPCLCRSPQVRTSPGGTDRPDPATEATHLCSRRRTTIPHLPLTRWNVPCAPCIQASVS